MAERRHRPALDQAHVAVPGRPSVRSAPRETPSASRAARVAGANQCSSVRRSPASAPTRLTSTISPPGLSTRANSSSVASGCGHRGDDVLRDHDVERRVRETSGARRPSPPGPRRCAGRARRPAPAPCAASAPRCRRRRCGCCAAVVGQRDAGADADLEDAAADALGRGDGGAARRARTRRRTRDRRPGPSAHRRCTMVSLSSSGPHRPSPAPFAVGGQHALFSSQMIRPTRGRFAAVMAVARFADGQLA